MGIFAYGLLALALVSALGGIAYKVRESGYDSCKVEWSASDAAASEKVEAERQRQEQISRDAAKGYEVKISKQARVINEMRPVLDAHIRAAKFPRSCVLTPSLFDDINKALLGAESPAPGSLPKSGRTPDTPVRPVDGKPAAKAAGGGG